MPFVVFTRSILLPLTERFDLDAMANAATSPISRPAIRVVALLLFLVSGTALIGWIFGIAWMVQPVAGFPPVRPNSAVGLFAIAWSLIGLLEGQRGMVLGGGLSAVLIGAVTIAETAWGVDLRIDNVLLRPIAGLVWGDGLPGRMSMTSAMFLLLGGAATAAFASGTRFRAAAHIMAGVLGTVILAVAATVIAAHARGLLRGVEYGFLVGSSVQSIVSALLLGSLLLGLAWERDAALALPQRWLPYAVGVASVVTTLLVWQALIEREQVQVREQVSIAMQAARRTLNRQLQTIEDAMRRVASFSAAQPPLEEWQRNVGTLVHDTEGLTEVAWLAADGAATAAAPADTGASGLRAVLVDRGLVGAPETGIRYLQGRDDDALVAVTGVCDGRGCHGTLAGGLSVRGLMAPVLSDTSQGFHFAVSVGGHVLARTAVPDVDARGYAATSTFRAGDMRIDLAVWPTRTALERTRSDLPDLVLVLGLVVSGLLAVTLRLAQNARTMAERQERARLNRALERATDGIWEWDVPSGSATRSAALWRHLGYQPKEMAPRASAWTALIHPEDRERVTAALTEHLAGRREAYEAEYRIQARDGDWHIIVDRGRVVQRSAGGTAERVLGISADITDRRRTEEAMREMETLSTMGRLAARVAHEINNPLGGIQNSFLLIKDAVPPTHPHFKYVGAIEREIGRIAAITRQLYETYRPESEVRSDAAVRTVVGDAVSLLEQVNRGRHVTITVDLSRAPTIIPVPDAVLRQCVYNLIQNAVEASPDGATVAVGGEAEGGAFVLRVRDHGAGIPRELQARVFEPFFSTKDASVQTGGMGLGLALVRRSVQALGGTIDILIPADGGTEFVVRLPLRPTPPGERPA